MSDCQSPEIISCPDNIPGCLVLHTKPKQETITIKKALWDEMLEANDLIKNMAKIISFNEDRMLEYKKKVDELEDKIERFDKVIHPFKNKLHELVWPSMIELHKRIQELENLGADVLQDFEKRIIDIKSNTDLHEKRLNELDPRNYNSSQIFEALQNNVND